MRIDNCITREVVTLNPDDSLDRAIDLMEENGFHHLVVVEQEAVVGMLSDRDILISTGWMLDVERNIPARPGQRPEVVGPTCVGQIMARPVVSMSADDCPRTAALLMLKEKISALPVLDGGRLVGLVTETDLIRLLDAASLRGAVASQALRQSVRDKMRSDVVQATPHMPLDHIVGLFRARRIRHIPIVEDGGVRGIISDRDVRRALGWSVIRDAQAQEQGRLAQPDPQCAADIMQTPVLSIGPRAPLSEALQLMLGHGIHALPVVEEGRLVGMVTQSDLVRLIAQQRDVVPNWSLTCSDRARTVAPIAG
jgi:CBS domain-containing protein